MKSSHTHPSWDCFLSDISSLFQNSEVKDAKERYEHCDGGEIMTKQVFCPDDWPNYNNEKYSAIQYI